MRQPWIVPVGEVEYELVWPYVYEWQEYGRSLRISIPKGFRYDGATVPRAAWTLTGLRPDGLIRASAILHDWLYHHDGVLPVRSYEYLGNDNVWVADTRRWTRKEADDLFLKMMLEAGLGKTRSYLAYYAVRAFGGRYWEGEGGKIEGAAIGPSEFHR